MTGYIKEIKGKAKKVYKAGDCVKPRRIGDAIKEGLRIGISL